MRGHATVTEENLDRIFLAASIIPNGNEIIAHRMGAEIQNRFELVISADFAAKNSVQRPSHIQLPFHSAFETGCRHSVRDEGRPRLPVPQ